MNDRHNPDTERIFVTSDTGCHTLLEDSDKPDNSLWL